MLWFLALNVLFLLIYVLWRKEVGKYTDIDRLIPGPPKNPFFGNIHEFGDSISELLKDVQRLFDKYGPLVRIWVGPFKMKVFITEPKYLEFFMSSKVHLNKSPEYTMLQPWLGRGLITSPGNIWNRHRKILTPAFHFKILENFSEIFNNLSQKLSRRLLNHIDKDINIYEFIRLFAMDAVCETSLKFKLNSLETNDCNYIDSAGEYMEIFFLRFYSLWKKFNFLFKLSPQYRKHAHATNILRGFTGLALSKRKEDRKYENNDNSSEKKVYIDIMLDNNEFTEEVTREHLDTILFAGHDTISTMLSLSLFELAKHPDVQQKILDELDEIVGGDTFTPITLQDVKRLSYLERVVKECLRLYSPSPMIEREVGEDVEFDGMKIPKGTILSFHLFWLHRRPDIYPNPEMFDPDRFLPENVSKRHNFSFVPFSAGPRNCIGQKYAIVNAKITIANILRNFVLTPVKPDHKLILANDGVLKSIGGVPIRLSLRKKHIGEVYY